MKHYYTAFLSLIICLHKQMFVCTNNNNPHGLLLFEDVFIPNQHVAVFEWFRGALLHHLYRSVPVFLRVDYIYTSGSDPGGVWAGSC